MPWKAGAALDEWIKMTERSVPRPSDGVANLRGRERAPQVTTHKRADGPVFLCAGCGKPIRGATGYIEVDTGAASARARYFAELNRKSEARRYAPGWTPAPLAEVFEELDGAPPLARWTAWHRACDPAPSSSTYWIGSERIATWRQMVDWTAHLREKRWIEGTDWFHMTRGQAGGVA